MMLKSLINEEIKISKLEDQGVTLKRFFLNKKKTKKKQKLQDTLRPGFSVRKDGNHVRTGGKRLTSLKRPPTALTKVCPTLLPAVRQVWCAAVRVPQVQLLPRTLRKEPNRHLYNLIITLMGIHFLFF